MSTEQAAGVFRARPVGWVLHVTCMTGSPHAVFAGSKSPNRRFSHLWVGRDGRVEQYAPLTHQSWAQGAGNGTYWSVETDGQPGDPLTDAQLDALTAWHVWCGAADLVASGPGSPGIGTHYMGGQPWGAHSCPDPQGREGKGPRSQQRTQIIARARALRAQQGGARVAAEVDLTVKALQDIGETVARAVSSIDAVHPVLVGEGTGKGQLPDGRDIVALPDALGEILRTVRELRADLAAFKASVGR